MNNQQAFTIVARHLLTQNSASLDKGGDNCLYRGTDNKKCAIGCLIPDELYTADMEGIAVTSLLTKFSSLGQLFKDIYPSMLDDLQTIHDYRQVESWKTELQKLAATLNLQWELPND